MKMQEFSEKITALIDNEIRSQEERDELKFKINSDSSLYQEYITQNSLKELLSERFSRTKAPSHLHENVLKQSMNLHNAELEKISSSESSSKKKESIFNIFRKTKFAIPIAIAVIALFLSSPLFSEKSPHDLIIEQSGSDNMYVQAVNNFKSILNGELNVQCSSSNPVEVKTYFAENGVPYETKVPTFQYWNLVGGVVSEDSGKKFAHQVYTGNKGEILYLYQVDIDFVSENNEPIKLSKDLLTYLHDGNQLKMLDSSYKTFLWENDHKLFALVTNEDPQMIEDNFIASF